MNLTSQWRKKQIAWMVCSAV